MLVIVRKKDEVIKIGENTYVKVLSTHSNRVVIGVDAPRTVPVFRQELLTDNDRPTEPA